MGIGSPRGRKKITCPLHSAQRYRRKQGLGGMVRARPEKVGYALGWGILVGTCSNLTLLTHAPPSEAEGMGEKKNTH